MSSQFAFTLFELVFESKLCYTSDVKLRYSIDVLPEEDGKGYFVVVPVLPGCFSQGETVEEAVRNVREAIELHIQCLRKQGEEVPAEDHAFHTEIEVAA
jgi:predicted RNase H-like HicB family nuclease